MERKVSFLIPAYNEEESIPELYKQVMDNVRICMDEGLMDDYEFLFINDGSSDGTSAIAHEFEAARPGTVRVIDKENSGYGANMNRGISEARGRYIAILEPDDYVLPPWMLFKEGSATDAADKILHYAENWNEPQFLDLRERLFQDRTDEDFKRNVSRIFDKLFAGGFHK